MAEEYLQRNDKVQIRLFNGVFTEGRILEMEEDSARVRVDQLSCHAAMEALFYPGIDECIFKPNEKGQWWGKDGSIIVHKIED